MTVLMIAILMLIPSLVSAQQQPVDLNRAFEAGRYEEVVAAVQAERSPTPDKVYLAARSHEKLSRAAEAYMQYSMLAARPEKDPWKHIGASAVLLTDGNADAALAAAKRATRIASALPAAHYQLGVAFGYMQDYANAAVAFEKAASLNPTFAYAYYHGGLSHYRAKRVDLMAKNFEAFLKLAPETPERAEVESIMRTLRGRR